MLRWLIVCLPWDFLPSGLSRLNRLPWVAHMGQPSLVAVVVIIFTVEAGIW